MFFLHFLQINFFQKFFFCIFFERAVKELFAGIPYQLHIPREAYYHSKIINTTNDMQAAISALHFWRWHLQGKK